MRMILSRCLIQNHEMKKIIFYSLLLLSLSACNPSNNSDNSESKKDVSPKIEKKEYTFVETVRQRNADFTETVVERQPVKIVATSDTAALMIAYRNRCITEAKNLNNSSNPYPKSFTLYDDTGADVSVSIMKRYAKDEADLEKRAKAIRAEVFKLYEVEDPGY